MLESHIERKLCERIKALGGLCEKFTSPSRRNVPDRIITLPGGVVEFVECKAPGKSPTKAQLLDHKRRRALGCTVRVVASVQDIDDAYPL